MGMTVTVPSGRFKDSKIFLFGGSADELSDPTIRSKHRVGIQVIMLLWETQQWIQAQGDKEERSPLGIQKAWVGPHRPLRSMRPQTVGCRVPGVGCKA